MKRTGPPKKPTALKLVEGTYRADRALKNEAKPPVKIPPVPARLSDLGKREWKRMSRQLFALGLLADIDHAALEAYCDCYSDYCEARELCTTKEGQDRKVIKTAAGNFVENPYFSIKKRCLELMHKFLTEFGMTPASRTRINAEPVGDNGKKKESKSDKFYA